MYLSGELQDDIAKALGIDQSTVSRDLKALQGEWLASSLRDFDEMKAQELAKIDRLEREYWRGWERSCEDAETVRQEASKGDDGKPSPQKVVKTAKGQAGDPRFLAGVMTCIDRRCKILGVDAATKSQNLNMDMSKLTTAQLERIAAGENPINVLSDTSAS